MSLPKILALVSILLFGIIGIAAIFKDKKNPGEFIEQVTITQPPMEVELDQEIHVAIPPLAPKEQPQPIKIEISSPVAEVIVPAPEVQNVAVEKIMPEVNRIEELFSRDGLKLPIVETITYKSRVPWQKGRPAWLSDYASHYATSRHFIARSLNGKPNYLKQDLAEGDRFNVFRQDKNFNFYLLIDVSRSKMLFYYIDLDNHQATLIKTYDVGLGRMDGSKTSGWLTPLGQYSLGSKTASYKPKVTGFHNGEKTELIRVFGTRWIPFEKEVKGCTAPAKGLGIHGVPWIANAQTGVLEEDRSSIGKHESDGCVRMSTADVEELFAIIVTKPTTVDLVKDYFEAIPGTVK